MAVNIEERIQRLCANVPKELKQLPQWVVWRLEPDSERPDEKPDKTPYQPADPDRRASHSNPQTWSTFDEALHVYKFSQGGNFQFDGIGFVFTEDDPFVFLDIDSLKENDKRYEWVATCGSYAEYSQSGKGLHIILKGKLPLKTDGYTGRKSAAHNVEAYDRKRFCAFTGNVVEGYTTIKEGQKNIDSFLEKYFPKIEEPLLRDLPTSEYWWKYTNQQLWDMLLNSKDSSATRIKKLFDGDYIDYPDDNGRPDHHRGDIALCNDLAFATCGNPAQIDSMFSESGMYRSKWDRKDYKETTIRKALATTKHFYKGPTPRADRVVVDLNGTGDRSAAETPKPLEPEAPAPGNEQPLTEGWTIYSLADAYAERPPTEYIVDGLIPLPSLSIVYGAPGALKSLLLQDMAACILAGKPWLSTGRRLEGDQPTPEGKCFSTKYAPVLWIDLDNGKQRTHEHVEAVSKARNLPSDKPFRYVSMPTPFPDFSSQNSVQMTAQYIKQAGAKLVFIDTLTMITGNIDLNDSKMSVVMGNLRKVAEDLGVAIIVIHHQRKSNGNEGARKGERLLGHTSIEGSLDLALLVERKEGESSISCCTTKVRGYVEQNSFGATFVFKHKPGTKDLAEAKFQSFVPPSAATLRDQAIKDAIIKALEQLERPKQKDLIDFVHSAWLPTKGAPTTKLIRLVLLDMRSKGEVSYAKSENEKGQPERYWL